jgi:hypothetical protein
LTEGIEDGRSFTIDVQPGVEWYDLDPTILKLRKATDTATGLPVRMLNQEKAGHFGVHFNGTSGKLNTLVFGIEKHSARAWPVPAQAMTLALDTFRLPYTVEAGDDFEIDEQHHIPLLSWVKHKAYSIQDSEVTDNKKAQMFEARFRDYCVQARKEQERARRVVGSVVYGGL